jgi:DNA-binding transcriptional MerR regulator
MKTVTEVSRLTGLSVRTLHYYDAVGLLKPDAVTGAGYRLYGGKALCRLQQILFFRELGFPLAEIRKILDNPSFDPREALRNHREMLLLERNRLDELIRLADDALKGESTMSFQGFDESPLESERKKYMQEAKDRWGGTEAYRESERRTAGFTESDWNRVNTGAEAIWKKFAACMAENPPESPAAQSLVAEWQNFISANYYSCTDKILSGLGQMYSADPRFVKSIDRCGIGTADYMSRAIAAHFA